MAEPLGAFSRKSYDRPRAPQPVSTAFRRSVDRLGLPPVRLHDLRHSWASHALEAGVPLKVVSGHLGHSTFAVTADVYVHVSDESADRWNNVVAGYRLGGSKEREPR